jgi:hypothetical protein
MSRREIRFGTVIAERRLHPRGAPRRTVVVSIGKPRKTKHSGEWECPFRIAGAGIRRLEYGRGVDAFQALTTALAGIRYFLDRLDTALVWGGVFEDQSGFQRLIPLLDRRITERMERAVDREARRWLQELKRRHRAAQRRKPRPRSAPR